MKAIQAYMFGRFRLVVEGRQDEVKLSHSAQNLLAYLLLERNRTHPREVLSGLFWGDYGKDRARCCLNTALWRIRSSLVIEAPGIKPLINSPSGDVGINPACDWWLDVETFEHQVEQALAHPVERITSLDIQALKSCQELYRGNLLEGVYDDWALRAREYLRAKYQSALGRLLIYYKMTGDLQSALECAYKILAVEPLIEEVHREVMRLYLARGERALAIRQYEICRQTLAHELGIQPMEETQALFETITASNFETHLPYSSLSLSLYNSVANPSTFDIHEVLRQLQETTLTLQHAQNQLQYVLTLIENPGTIKF